MDYASQLLQPVSDKPDASQTGQDYASQLVSPNIHQGATFPPSGDDIRFREADAPTTLGRIGQMIRGKQDPRYKDVGAYTGSYGARMGAGLVTHDDAAYGDIVTKSLGNRLVRRFQDANGYDLIEYKGEGKDADKTFRAYLNKPGLDRFDVSRGLMSAIPFVATGGAAGVATGGAGLAARATAQAAAAGATSMAQDVAAKPLGSEQGIDAGRAALFAGLGAGGELASAALKPIVDRWRASGLVQNGQLTANGEALAKQAGLDPAQIKGYLAEEFRQTYAKTGDATQAALRVSRGEFDIPTTVGQRLKRPDLLQTEEGMRRNLYGDQARRELEKFDLAQQQAIDAAARGGVRRTLDAKVDEAYGVAPTLAPKRDALERPTREVLGERVGGALGEARQAAKALEQDAWSKPMDLLATKEARDLLPQIIDGKLAGMTVDPQLMPASGKMAEMLKSYQSGEMQNLSVGVFGTNPRAATVDEMRRRLGSLTGTAANDTDRAAAKAIYHGYNEWIEQAANKHLLAGDAQAAANLRQAIDVTREYRGLFNPRDATGRGTPGAKILQDVLNEGTPERIVQRLFGGQPVKSQAPPAGTVDALKSMKEIFQKYGPDPRTAINPWDDVRLAYWLKLVQDTKGETLSPTQLVNNIKGAFANQNSALRVLYSSEELAMMRRLMGEVEKAAYKPPNPSGTSYGVAQFGKEAVNTVLKAVGLATKGWGDALILALLRPVRDIRGQAMAGRATAQEAGRRVPFAVSGQGAAAGAAAGLVD